MRNKIWKNTGIACKLMWDMDRGLVIYSIIGAIIEAVNPFIGIFLSAYVLDGLQNGQTFPKLLLVSLASVSAIFLLTILHSCLERLKNIRIDMCIKRYDTLMSIKTITMDYPLVDSPKVNDIRTRINHDNDWGCWFLFLYIYVPLAHEQLYFHRNCGNIASANFSRWKPAARCFRNFSTAGICRCNMFQYLVFFDQKERTVQTFR